MSLRALRASNYNENNKKEITIEEIHQEQDNEFNKYTITIYFFEQLHQKITFVYYFIYSIIKTISNMCGIYLVWILLHYTSCHLYVYFCVPKTIYGFLMSPFMTATPHCLGLRWIIYNAGNMINNMWLILGTWICSTLLIVKK